MELERMRRALFGLVTAVSLSGCAAPISSTPSAGSAPARPVFATQLAGPSTLLAPMPTAVVLLKPDDLNRNRAFCRAFTSRLPTAQAAMAASAVTPNLVLTRWLVQLPDIPPGRATDCDFLVGTYDYARASRLFAALRPTDGQLSGLGPFLLMVIPDATGLHVAGLDGSGYDSSGFDGFINAWASALRQTEQQVGRTPDQPGVARSLFNLVSAILRAAAGGAAGLVRGVIDAV